MVWAHAVIACANFLRCYVLVRTSHVHESSSGAHHAHVRTQELISSSGAHQSQFCTYVTRFEDLLFWNSGPPVSHVSMQKGKLLIYLSN